MKGNLVYVKTLEELGVISEGGCSPKNIVETWTTDYGSIEISFDLKNKRHSIIPEYLEDYLDMNTLIETNKIIAKSESRYEMLQAFDQSAFVLWINNKTKTALIERGWKFAW